MHLVEGWKPFENPREEGSHTFRYVCENVWLGFKEYCAKNEIEYEELDVLSRGGHPIEHFTRVSHTMLPGVNR